MSSKITKASPDSFEVSVAHELANLEASSADWKAELKDLSIAAAKEVEVSGGRKAIIIFVPHPQLKDYHKIQTKLVRELEKKFRSGKTTGPRPRSRTLTAVHESILEDLVYPTEIVGKRIRYRVDGSKTLKVLLDPKDQANVDTKLDTFKNVYLALTNKDVSFEFPVETA